MAQERLQIRLDAVDNTKKAFNSLNNNTSKAKQALLSLKNVLIGIGAGVAIKSIINVTSNFEDLRDSLSSVTGSVKEGAKSFEFIQDFALRSQFSVEDLTTSFITLKASGIDPTEKLLRVFTDTAAVTTDQLGTLEALTRVFSRGVQGGLGLEELNQIADRGVPIFRLLEEEIGLGRLEIAKFGQSTDGAKKILDALEKSLGKTFKGATQQKLDNLSTSSSNLGIAFRNFQDIIGQSGFGQAIASLFNSLSELLVVLNPLGKALGVIGGVLVDVLTFAVGNTIKSIQFLGGVFNEFQQILLAVIGIALKPFESTILKIKQAFEVLRDSVKNIVDKSLVNLQKGLQLIIEKYQQLKRLLGIETEQPKPPEIGINKGTFEEQKSFFDQIKAKIVEIAGYLAKDVKSALDVLSTEWNNIEQTISKGIVFGVQSISKGIAESIILGKNLSDTFRQLAQQVLITIIQKTIERIILLGIEKLLAETIFKKEKEKEQVIAKQNSKLKQQLALQTAIAAVKAFSGFGFAEGGRVNGTRANGGATQNGNAYIVGERGRELFIPSTDGQIISNENLKSMGGSNITFNINATDVKGVQELLIDNRATITNIINSALNQKGKPALI